MSSTGGRGSWQSAQLASPAPASNSWWRAKPSRFGLARNSSASRPWQWPQTRADRLDPGRRCPVVSVAVVAGRCRQLLVVEERARRGRSAPSARTGRSAAGGRRAACSPACARHRRGSERRSRRRASGRRETPCCRAAGCRELRDSRRRWRPSGHRASGPCRDGSSSIRAPGRRAGSGELLHVRDVGVTAAAEVGDRRRARERRETGSPRIPDPSPRHLVAGQRGVGVSAVAVLTGETALAWASSANCRPFDLFLGE